MASSSKTEMAKAFDDFRFTKASPSEHVIAPEDESNDNDKLDRESPSDTMTSSCQQLSKYKVLCRLCPELDIGRALTWRTFEGEHLRVDYTRIFSKSVADKLFRTLETEIEYYTGDLTKLRVFGKWHILPRKQVAYGDPGLTYSFSGACIPAKPWLPLLSDLRSLLGSVTGHDFNFVLVNRYKDGLDHIGEHRDNEKDLSPFAPIASLSLGQERDFVFRHVGSRKGAQANQPKLPPVTVSLEHGSLLLMKYPTNKHWYHSLPVRKRCPGPRINLTFRQILI